MKRTRPDHRRPTTDHTSRSVVGGSSPVVSSSDLLSALALTGFDLAAYWPLLDPARMLADYDAFVYFYPLRAYAAASIQAGRLPLWNPHTFLGVPFIANPQTAVFYPPTALFYWLPVPQAYGLSIALHVLLSGLFFYAFCRVSLAVAPPAALVGGLAFMLGGVLSGQYGHLNQLSAAAWLPLILLCGERAVARSSRRLVAATAGLIGLQLLAGHPQQTYMTLAALGLLALWRVCPNRPPALLRAAGLLAAMVGLGLALAAVQLLPMAELAALSIRGGGLSYRDAIADSLAPWLLARALLPSFVNDLGSTELLGYVGTIPLVLAAIAVGAADCRRLLLLVPLGAFSLLMALGGANPLYPLLYAAVPGLSSFRVPARWLLLYTLAAAGLAALGLDWLLRRFGWRLSRAAARRLAGTLLALALLALAAYLGGARAPRWLQAAWVGGGLLGLLLAAGCARPGIRRLAVPLLVMAGGLELWLAGGDLAPRHPVPLEAYAQPRDSTLYLQSRLSGGRMLSLASEEYELKETPDYREWYGPRLSDQALTAFLVAAKRNEVLTPNLNLLYRIDSVDGYDGGLLPLRRYLDLASLVVPDGRLRPDGVLISRLESLPSRELMDLLNLRVVLAGRAKDLDADGFIFDRSILVSLRAGERLELRRVPGRSYTAAGLLSWLEGADVPDGAMVGQLELTAQDGSVALVPLLAGRDTAPGRRGGRPLPTGLVEVQPWSWTEAGDTVEYQAQVDLPSVALKQLALTALHPGIVLNLRALTLIDERDGGTTPLVLDDRLERTAFFDMKVYEYATVLPRAYLVHRAASLEPGAAESAMTDVLRAPRSVAAVEAPAPLQLTPTDGRDDSARVATASPEHVDVETRSATDALLVLSDAFYPGWRARVDGQETEILRANLHLRSVLLPAGEHRVTFTFEPDSFRLGLVVSAAALALLVLLVLLPHRRGAEPNS